jgi:hypothetical protein
MLAFGFDSEMGVTSHPSLFKVANELDELVSEYVYTVRKHAQLTWEIWGD